MADTHDPESSSSCPTYRRLAGVVAQLQQDTGELRDFIERRGYRRCDIAACNCGSFHGGLAEDRLREISESLSDAGVNGGTVHGGVLRIIADKEAAEGALAHLREQVRQQADKQKAVLAAIYKRTGSVRTWGVDESKVNYEYPGGEFWLERHAADLIEAYTAALASQGTPRQEEKKNEDLARLLVLPIHQADLHREQTSRTAEAGSNRQDSGA